MKDLPFSMRNITEAYCVGMKKFGWSKRHAVPRTVRDGRYLIGYGVATAFYPAYQLPAAAKVEMHADGTALAQSAMHEMGMGSATVQAQNLADELGLAFDKVRSSMAIRCSRMRQWRAVPIRQSALVRQ